MPSPTPTKRTGRPSSCLMATVIPPFAVPSSFVRTTPVSPADSPNTRACAMAFCPVVASSTRSTSVCTPGSSRAITRRIFSSSLIRFFLLCKRPAVSHRSKSQPFARKEAIASNTTAAGSAPSPCFTIGTPARSAQTVSCSAAAARKVSAAAIMGLRPSDL